MPTLTLTDAVAGTDILAALVNSNNAALKTLLNGGLKNDNVDAAAALVVAKLAAGANGQFLQTSAGVPVWGAAPSSAPGYGTSLPGSPTEGQEYILVDSTTNPTYQWRFRYNPASSSSFKWEFVGGAPIVKEVATSEGTTSTSYAALSTAGPSFTLPVQGDFVITIGARIDQSLNNQSGRMSYDIGATGAVDGDSIFDFPGGANTGSSGMRAMLKTGLTAVALVAKYKASGGTATFASRFLAVLPVRVS